MPYLDEKQRRSFGAKMRAMEEAMTKALELPSGLDFAAAYAAVKSMADGFRVLIKADLVLECDELADELTRERLAAIGFSKDGAN